MSPPRRPCRYGPPAGLAGLAARYERQIALSNSLGRRPRLPALALTSSVGPDPVSSRALVHVGAPASSNQVNALRG